jgi:hypothetical protein
MLSDVPPRVLADLCRTLGRERLLEQGRCRALLADVCGGYRREVFLLDCVARERLVNPVLSVGMPVEFAVNQLASRIVQELSVDSEAARWAAAAWAAAMGWTSEGHVAPKATDRAGADGSEAGDGKAQASRVLIEGILRAFRGALGDVGIEQNADTTLIEAVFAAQESGRKARSAADAWATVRFLTFTRQPRGLVFTDDAVNFLNPAATVGHQCGSWSLARLQEAGPRRQGLQEICLSAGDDRMNLEATGIPVSTMLLFLDLVREVVGPFLADHALPTSAPSPRVSPNPRKRARR